MHCIFVIYFCCISPLDCHVHIQNKSQFQSFNYATKIFFIYLSRLEAYEQWNSKKVKGELSPQTENLMVQRNMTM